MNRLIFFDRDGVINEEPFNFGSDYITDKKLFKFSPRVFSALRLLVDNSYDIYVISNQAGVGKGIFSKDVLDEITDYMLEELNRKGIVIKGVRYCTHTPDENCNCRKPRTQLFEDIYKEYNSDKKKLFFITDQQRDIEAALNFGIKSILILGGKSRIKEIFDFKSKPDYIAFDLYDAVENVVLK